MSQPNPVWPQQQAWQQPQYPPQQPWQPGPQAAPQQQWRQPATYVRPQQGHSLIKHLLLGAFVFWIPTIYYAISPNHYFHA